MARIGIDIRNIGKQRTGDEAVFFNLVKNLEKIDKENEYFLFTDADDAVELQYIEERLEITGSKNFKIVSLKSFNKFTWNFYALSNYLKKKPVDVYHTQYITPFFVPKNIKVVAHIHDVSFLAYPKFVKRMDLFFLNILIPKSLERADKIIAVSQFTKNEIVKYYGVSPQKIVVVYNAIGGDFLESDYSGNELFEIREKYNLPEKFILYIGTMQPRKNLSMLVKAFAKVKERIPKIKLVLVGNRKARNFDQKIKKEIKKLKLENEVIFPGFVDEKDKAGVFQMAEVFVYPSLYEGFGIPIIEAMSQKIPVLVSEIPVHIEISQKCALFFSPESLDDFSEKLYNSLADKNLRENLIYPGLQRSMIFSWEKSAEEILNIYKSLVQ